MPDTLHHRWLIFREVKPYPRDTNDILEDVANQIGSILETVEAADQIQELLDAGLVVIHAHRGDEVFEVRLSHEEL